MRAQRPAEEKTGPATTEAGQHYQCCFCGKGIQPKPPDVCALVLHTAFELIASVTSRPPVSSPSAGGLPGYHGL